MRDERFVRGPVSAMRRRLEGAQVTSAERVGKVLVLDTTSGRLGLRFGMTGVLGFEGDDSLDELVYGPSRRDPAWIRMALQTTAGELYVRDPRILGSAELDPDLTRLGPDATTVTSRQLAAALGGSRTALKARLMDQSRVAGVGNLIADEALWRASMDPRRPAGSLASDEVTALGRHVRRTVADLLRAGGSHLGRLTPQRRPGGRCPRDGAELRRSTVGGRTTWWCPQHQTTQPPKRSGTNP